MTNPFPNFKAKFDLITAKLQNFVKNSGWGILAFILSFTLGIFFINLTIARSTAIKYLKAEIASLQSDLNEFGLDIAYDNYETRAVYTRPLMTFENFQLYRPGQWSFTIPNLKLKNSIWNSRRFYILLGEQQNIQTGEKNITVTSSNAEIQIGSNDGSQLDLLLAQIKDIKVKDYLSVGELNLAGRRLGTHNDRGTQLSVFENHTEIKNLKFSGSTDYPLTSTIGRIYFKTNFMGNIKSQTPFTSALEDWLHLGGYIAIPSLVVNWEPLYLVGRGEINFNEKLIPALHLMTSSKALFKLLDDLQDRNLLSRKGVFVAKILLGNKAFKLEETDEHLSVITPIDFRDHKLAVENITIRDFSQPILQ